MERTTCRVCPKGLASPPANSHHGRRLELAALDTRDSRSVWQPRVSMALRRAIFGAHNCEVLHARQQLRGG